MNVLLLLLLLLLHCEILMSENKQRFETVTVINYKS